MFMKSMTSLHGRILYTRTTRNVCVNMGSSTLRFLAGDILKVVCNVSELQLTTTLG